MRKLVKILAFFTSFTLVSTVVLPQLKLPAANGTGSDIKKVLADYPNGFQNIIGDVIAVNSQSTKYECRIAVSGAEETSVTRFSGEMNTMSWEAAMLSTESFNKAKQRFRVLFGQLNNLPITLSGQTYRLRGDYAVPSEEAKFTSVVFFAEPAKESVKKLRAELIIEFYAPIEWKVKLLVYDREKDDDESGERNENGN